jgi:hypothetical protein
VIALLDRAREMGGPEFRALLEVLKQPRPAQPALKVASLVRDA